MDAFDCDVICDFLLEELQALNEYCRDYINDTLKENDEGTYRMQRYQAKVLREHLKDQLERVRLTRQALEKRWKPR